jgi:hypothetical protein
MFSPFEKGGLRGIFKFSTPNKIPRHAKNAWHPLFQRGKTFLSKVLT